MIFGRINYTIVFSFAILLSCKTQKNCISIKPCDINEVNRVAKNIYKIKNAKIANFFCTIKKECDNNVEFSEASNHVLFKLLENRAESFVRVFSKCNSVDKEYILLEISAPLLDYNIESIVLKIQESKGDSISKIQLINALKKADEE